MRGAHLKVSQEVAKSLITERIADWAAFMIFKVKLLERDHNSEEIPSQS
jgi:hypothetical protein